MIDVEKEWEQLEHRVRSKTISDRVIWELERLSRNALKSVGPDQLEVFVDVLIDGYAQNTEIL